MTAGPSEPTRTRLIHPLARVGFLEPDMTGTCARPISDDEGALSLHTDFGCGESQNPPSTSKTGAHVPVTSAEGDDRARTVTSATREESERADRRTVQRQRIL